MTKRFRMTQQAHLILLALENGRQHGYAMISQVAELSAGAVRLGAGALYGNLDRLLGAGLIAADGEEIVDGRARRYYRITDDGVRVARAETARLAELAARAAQVHAAADRKKALPGVSGPAPGRRPALGEA